MSSEGSEYLLHVTQKHTVKHTETQTVDDGFVCLGVQYLDSGVKRRSVLLLEAGSDVQHVHLAPRHHYPHQGAVISSSALNIETYSAAGGGV